MQKKKISFALFVISNLLVLFFTLFGNATLGDILMLYAIEQFIAISIMCVLVLILALFKPMLDFDSPALAKSQKDTFFFALMFAFAFFGLFAFFPVAYFYDVGFRISESNHLYVTLLIVPFLVNFLIDYWDRVSPSIKSEFLHTDNLVPVGSFNRFVVLFVLMIEVFFALFFSGKNYNAEHNILTVVVLVTFIIFDYNTWKRVSEGKPSVEEETSTFVDIEDERQRVIDEANKKEG